MNGLASCECVADLEVAGIGDADYVAGIGFIDDALFCAMKAVGAAKRIICRSGYGGNLRCARICRSKP